MPGTLLPASPGRQLCGKTLPDGGTKGPDARIADVSEPASPSVQRVIFRVPTTGLLPLGLLAICETPVVATAGPAFALLYLIPIVFAVWILRTRTVVDSEQLRTRSLFGARTLAWADIRSLKLP